MVLEVSWNEINRLIFDLFKKDKQELSSKSFFNEFWIKCNPYRRAQKEEYIKPNFGVQQEWKGLGPWGWDEW
jgi:hypothetical protein